MNDTVTSVEKHDTENLVDQGVSKVVSEDRALAPVVEGDQMLLHLLA